MLIQTTDASKRGEATGGVVPESPDCSSLRATFSGRAQPVEYAVEPANDRGGCQHRHIVRSKGNNDKVVAVQSNARRHHCSAHKAAETMQHIEADDQQHAPCTQQAAMSITTHTLDLASMLKLLMATRFTRPRSIG